MILKEQFRLARVELALRNSIFTRVDRVAQRKLAEAAEARRKADAAKLEYDRAKAALVTGGAQVAA